MPRPQFTLRALLVLMLVVACFLGGVRFEREWQRRRDLEKARLAFEAERARILSEAEALQARLLESQSRLSESSARLEKTLQAYRERRKQAKAGPRVIPDVVWEDVPSTLEAK